MKLMILTTGGTIEKTYDEQQGHLSNEISVLDRILNRLRLPDFEITHVPVMNKDSLEMNEEDRQKILDAVKTCIPQTDAILLLHGTDTLDQTGNCLYQFLENLEIPIVLTGAMRPFEFRDTDAIQNVTESLLAIRMLKAGIYAVMHNRVLPFPNVRKNYKHLHFEAF